VGEVSESEGGREGSGSGRRGPPGPRVERTTRTTGTARRGGEGRVGFEGGREGERHVRPDGEERTEEEVDPSVLWKLLVAGGAGRVVG
jgi:hypothetical protein